MLAPRPLLVLFLAENPTRAFKAHVHSAPTTPFEYLARQTGQQSGRKATNPVREIYAAMRQDAGLKLRLNVHTPCMLSLLRLIHNFPGRRVPQL